jgi:L-ascorbate metabolism protein UlaG (beta-lactamase superfamily)
VLLVPVGGGGSLTPARASEVISLFEPNIVVPMYYKVPGLEMGLGTLKPFLKEMGLDRIEKEESLRVTKAGLPEETKVVALTPRKTNGG